MSDTTYLTCVACGDAIADADFAVFQQAKLDECSATQCGECIETRIRPALQPAFDVIHDALTSPHQADWEAMEFEEQFIQFLQYCRGGVITAADHSEYEYGTKLDLTPPPEIAKLVRLKAVKMLYESERGTGPLRPQAPQQF